MKRYTILGVFIIITTLVLSAFCTPKGCEKGEGDVIEKEISVSSFKKLHVKGSTTVNVTRGDELKVMVKGQENLINLLNKTVKDDTWTVKFEKCVKKMKKFEVFITIPELTAASVYGSGDILCSGKGFKTDDMVLTVHGSGDIVMEAKTKNITCSVKGSGDIKIKGSTKNYNASIAGSGDINGLKTETEAASIQVKGSGDASITVSESLTVEILGSGDVSYKGSPQNVQQSIKGSGEITHL